MSNTTFSGPVKSINGFVLPSLTTAEMNAISSPATGLMIFNSTVGAVFLYTGSAWINVQTEPIPAPTVLSISPNNGTEAGGTAVTIAGTEFTDATAVTIGGTAVTSFTVDSATQISAVTAAHAVGTGLSVNVTTPGGTNADNTLFAYTAAPTSPVFTYTEGTPLAAGNLLLTPDGTKAYTKNGDTISKLYMGSAWDVTGSSSGGSTVLPFNMMVNQTATMAYNADGTRLITIGNDAGYYPGYYTLGIPYDPFTVTGSFTKGTLTTADISFSPTQLFFSTDGTKAFVMDSNSQVYSWNLDLPYDLASFNGTADTTANLASLFNIYFNKPLAFTLSADGTIGYFAHAGNSYNGELVQFSLSTPFDLSTISSTPISTVSGWGANGSYGGIVLKPTTEDVILVSQSSGNTLQQFNAA